MFTILTIADALSPPAPWRLSNSRPALDLSLAELRPRPARPTLPRDRHAVKSAEPPRTTDPHKVAWEGCGRGGVLRLPPYPDHTSKRLPNPPKPCYSRRM